MKKIDYLCKREIHSRWSWWTDERQTEDERQQMSHQAGTTTNECHNQQGKSIHIDHGREHSVIMERLRKIRSNISSHTNLPNSRCTLNEGSARSTGDRRQSTLANGRVFCSSKQVGNESGLYLERQTLFSTKSRAMVNQSDTRRRPMETIIPCCWLLILNVSRDTCERERSAARSVVTLLPLA